MWRQGHTAVTRGSGVNYDEGYHRTVCRRHDLADEALGLLK